MRTMRFAAGFGVAAMVAVIAIAIGSGSFAEEGGQILDLAWGKVTLVDLYVGLLLVAVWIIWLERTPSRWIPWVVGLVLLGNLTTAAYVLLRAARTSSVTEALTGRAR
jgi:hypothetical protein